MDAFVYDTLNAWYQEDMGTVSVHSIGLRLSIHPDQLIVWVAKSIWVKRDT